ncbi:MAG TPA: RNA polymerase sigma factor SigZ [Bacteroidales bacterium]|nr:RNA polymerase sigma factor SigZ [Bacteroidales bacterium]
MNLTRTGQIWSTFADRLRSFISSKVHDKDVTEDILQEVFIRIHEKVDTLRDNEKLTSWIYQIARNLIADHFRKNKQASAVSDNEEDEQMENEPDFRIMETAVNDMIGMLDELPGHYCDALCKTEIGGMSQAEYARQAGIPYSSVKTRVQRSRKMLRDMLMQCCHYQFDKYGTVLNISPNACCCCNHN